MSPATLRPLGFGEILDGAFTLYRRNFVTFAVTTLIPTLAMGAGFLLLGRGLFSTLASDDPMEIIGSFFTGMFVLMIVSVLAALVMWPALTREAAQAYTGQPTSVADGFSFGLRAALPLLGAGILVWIGMMVAGFVVGLALTVVAGVLAVMGTVGQLLAGLVMLCGYLGFMLGSVAILFAVVPAIVVEGAGPLEALERSFTLARGALPRIVGLMLVTGLITYLPMLAALALTGGFTQMMNPQALPTPAQFMTQMVLSMGVGILTTPFLASVIVLLYFDRRVRTEALDVRMMADHLAVAGN